MRRALPLIAILASSCYLSHQRPEPADGAVDAPLGPAACCAVARCGETTCAAGEECDGHSCAAACEGPRCAGACCAAGELCLDGACSAPGPICAADASCPDGARCDLAAGRCLATTGVRCFAPRPFDAVVQWADTRAHAITVPLVVQLNDDNEDGHVGVGDIPDIVALTVPPGDPAGAIGTVIAFSGDDGRRLWEAGDMFHGLCSFTTAAAADLDGDGTIEIAILGRAIDPHVHHSEDPEAPLPCPPMMDCGPYFADRGRPHTHPGDPREYHRHTEAACTTFAARPGALFILSHEGELERLVPLPAVAHEERAEMVVIADLDADGTPEIIAGGAVVDALGVRWSDPRIAGVGLAVGDVDLDGRMEIATARGVFEDDGTPKWLDDVIDPNGHPAIARVVRDASSGPPQVVQVDAARLVVRDGVSGAPLLGPLLYGAGRSAGPPTIADFDGDGRAEIGVAADHAYVVFDPDLPEPPHIRWAATSDDRTPGTVGASAFDFDGDGAADVACSDECHLRIYSGRDGATLFATSNPSRTVWEYPVVADVDGDGHAELVVGSNLRFPEQNEELGCDVREDPFRFTSGGVRVLRDRLGNWGATRSIWNEHGYHVDNVGDDGAIPASPPRSWETHNSWRANPRPRDAEDVDLPNLVVDAVRVDTLGCGEDDLVVGARVSNIGAASAPAHVPVAFQTGRRFMAQTDAPILPGGAEWVLVSVPRDALLDGNVTASVDEEATARECDEHDNRSPTLALACTRP